MSRLLGTRYENGSLAYKIYPGENHMTKFFNRFAKDESGATAIEYGLIAALIAVALITILTAVGTNLGLTFSSISDNIN
jgi:pilus assembly protein Flp/PilA